jgi:hypothetical protein
VPHDPLEQGVGQRGEAHRGAGVAVADLLHGVGRQHPDRVDRAAVQVGPVVGHLGAGERLDLVCGVGIGHGNSLGSEWDGRRCAARRPALRASLATTATRDVITA